MNKLQHLYQAWANRNAAPQLSADDLVALARGRSVDEHDAKLATLARSTEDAALLRLTQALGPAAQELAAGIAAVDAPARRPSAWSFAYAWRWKGVAAAAAVVLAMVVALPRTSNTELSTDTPNAGASIVADANGGDEILNVSFEESAALAAEHAVENTDGIFAGEFDS
jgi:anti-sigma-K factor RskA